MRATERGRVTEREKARKEAHKEEEQREEGWRKDERREMEEKKANHDLNCNRNTPKLTDALVGRFCKAQTGDCCYGTNVW